MKLFSSSKSESRMSGLASMADQDPEEQVKMEDPVANNTKQPQPPQQHQRSPTMSLLTGIVAGGNRRRSNSASAPTTTKTAPLAAKAATQTKLRTVRPAENPEDNLLTSFTAEGVPFCVRWTVERAMHPYDVTYEFGNQLGLGLGIEADLSRKDRSNDRVLVVAVFPTRASAVKGVQVGDYLAAINDNEVAGMAFDAVLTTIRTAPRPLKITFERPDNFTPGFSVDEFRVCRDWAANPPKDLADWQVYHVAYGMFRTPHQVQVYRCLTDYETALERAYRGQPLDMGSRMQPYTVTVDSELSELKEATYGNEVITFFTLKVNLGLCKSLKIGSTNHAAVVSLHSAIRNSIIDLNKRAAGCHLYSYY